MSVRPRSRYSRGISYPEVLAAVVMMAVLLVPAIEALRSALFSSVSHEQLLLEHYALRSKVEDLLSRPFGELEINAAGEATPSALSDAYLLANGSSVQRDVYIAAHDMDNADADNNPRTGTDDGALWLRVSIPNSNHSIEWVVSE